MSETLVVPGRMPMPRLRKTLRKYFDERYEPSHVVQVLLVSKRCCHVKVEKILDLPRNAETLRLPKVEKDFTFEIVEGFPGGEIITEV